MSGQDSETQMETTENLTSKGKVIFFRAGSFSAALESRIFGSCSLELLLLDISAQVLFYQPRLNCHPLSGGESLVLHVFLHWVET